VTTTSGPDVPAAGGDPAARFLALHVPGRPLLMANAWDRGSARLLKSLGFPALATTSSGFAATLGRLDGHVTLDEALEHSRALVEAVDVPVSADLEDGYVADPAGVAATVTAAVATGLAGCSIEDYAGRGEDVIYDRGLAIERVAAAAEAAHAGSRRLVLTARAENHLHGRDDVDDTIARLLAYQDAGADVLYAPRLDEPDALRRLLAEVDRPVNVLVRPGAPTVPELAELGVARISVGGAFAFAALGAVVEAARELLDRGTTGYGARAAAGRAAVDAPFSR
jgi:2-methylisocitrate lyase-like PEP mutase family enzyme